MLEIWLLLTNEMGVERALSERAKKISIAYDEKSITPVDKLRYDACISLEAVNDFKPNGNIGVQTLRGGKYAVITHIGPLENIETTYAILFGIWLPNSGYEPDDFPNFIWHRTMPYLSQPESLVTDIYLPIK